MQKAYLAPGEVADILMVSPATIRNWASKGELPSVSTPGGHRRFMRYEIEKFARDNDLAIQLPAGSMRVLIVDDDRHVSLFLSRFFAHVDPTMTTRIANDGFTAGRIVQEYQPHVVLLDLMMPGLNGFDVCAQIASDPSLKTTRVIAMTGFFDEINVQKALEAGAEICISKPFDEEQLLSLLGLSMTRNVSQRNEARQL
jgi:excisionase family DNA binding protein